MTHVLGDAPYWVYQWLPHAIVGAFVFAFGACVGSFVNVLVYRLPAGISVISPPSRCPVCGALLSWRENLPIVGWLALRGRCRRCGTPISPQYVVVELLTALLFLALYLAYFAAPPASGWWGQVGGAWWFFNGPFRAMPAFTLHVLLLAALVAMTLIDARTFTIPIQIPAWIAGAAFVLWPVQGFLPGSSRALEHVPLPVTDWRWTVAAVGGMTGVLVGCALLRAGVLRPSFDDYDDYVKEGETLGDYPHARREMALELLFLAPCIAGLALGWLAGAMLSAGVQSGLPPAPLALLGGSILGYLVGGAIVWLVRIVGTLAFGREAMGLGDVHLLAAVGAVLGWQDPLWVFFLAPFPGLAWAVLSKVLGARFATLRRELPFGPHLAIATVLVIFARPVISVAEGYLFPTADRATARTTATEIRRASLPAKGEVRPARLDNRDTLH